MDTICTCAAGNDDMDVGDTNPSPVYDDARDRGGDKERGERIFAEAL